jgi:superoxide reductase
MGSTKDLLQTADWKSEKHVPAIEIADKAKKGEFFNFTVSVGKEIPHPNTTEHHIAWINVYFLPQGEKFPYQIGNFEFSAHGGSVQGPNTSTVYTNPKITGSLKTDKPGTIFAVSYCNIHGLWESSQELNFA